MGKSYTPKYALEIVTVGSVRLTNQGWDVKRKPPFRSDGKPTPENIRTKLAAMQASFLPGGVNEQIGDVKILGGRIKENFAGGDVVAEYFFSEEKVRA